MLEKGYVMSLLVVFNCLVKFLTMGAIVIFVLDVILDVNPSPLSRYLHNSLSFVSEKHI